MTKINTIGLTVSEGDTLVCVQVICEDWALYLHGASFEDMRAFLRKCIDQVDVTEARDREKAAQQAISPCGRHTVADCDCDPKEVA